MGSPDEVILHKGDNCIRRSNPWGHMGYYLELYHTVAVVAVVTIVVFELYDLDKLSIRARKTCNIKSCGYLVSLKRKG